MNSRRRRQGLTHNGEKPQAFLPSLKEPQALSRPSSCLTHFIPYCPGQKRALLSGLASGKSSVRKPLSSPSAPVNKVTRPAWQTLNGQSDIPAASQPRPVCRPLICQASEQISLPPEILLRPSRLAKCAPSWHSPSPPRFALHPSGAEHSVVSLYDFCLPQELGPAPAQSLAHGNRSVYIRRTNSFIKTQSLVIN